MTVWIVKGRGKLAHQSQGVLYTTREKAEKALGNDGGYYVTSMKVI